MTSKTIEPCDGINFDVNRINQDIEWLLKYVSFDIIKDYFSNIENTKFGINLTHPLIEGSVLELIQSKWPNSLPKTKYIGPLTLGDKTAVQAGIDPSSYTIIGEEISNRYIGSVIEQVKQYHALTYPNLKPITRVYCAYLNPFAGYKLHIDTHTTFKYHLPLIENKYSFMFTEDESKLEMNHLPADGRLWKLDTSKLHSAVNMAPESNNYRMHIIFSVYDDPFNIYESPVYR